MNKITSKHINTCSFDKWYPIFSKYTIKSKIIPLTQDFIDYLQQDSIILPSSIVTKIKTYDIYDKDELMEWEQCWSKDTNSKEEDQIKETEQKEFPEIQKAIKQTLDEYGSVFPKLNWSAPKVRNIDFVTYIDRIRVGFFLVINSSVQL